MSIYLRIALIVVSVFTSLWIIYKIRKSDVLLNDAVFWVSFSFILIILGVFPAVLNVLINLFGIQSPSNLVFLIIIFFLILKVFLLSMRISKMEYKITEFAQKYSIDKNETLQNKKTEKE